MIKKEQQELKKFIENYKKETNSKSIKIVLANGKKMNLTAKNLYFLQKLSKTIS